MEKRKILLLNYLLKNCQDGYKVMETLKVMTCSKKYKNNYELFVKDIEYLKQRKFIDLKYLDESNICLTMLDNSRIMQDNIKAESGFIKKNLGLFVVFSIVSGIMSFAGAFLALLIFR